MMKIAYEAKEPTQERIIARKSRLGVGDKDTDWVITTELRTDGFALPVLWVRKGRNKWVRVIMSVGEADLIRFALDVGNQVSVLGDSSQQLITY